MVDFAKIQGLLNGSPVVDGIVGDGAKIFYGNQLLSRCRKEKFEKKSDSSFENIWLCGPAKLVFAGTINL